MVWPFGHDKRLDRIAEAEKNKEDAITKVRSERIEIQEELARMLPRLIEHGKATARASH